MTLSLITVTGGFVNPDGSEPRSGRVTATLSAPMTNGIQTIPPLQIVAIINALGQLVASDGASPFQLYPTNAPGTTPTGLGYNFTVVIDNIPIASFSAIIPYNAAGGTIDITALIPAALVPATAAFIPFSLGQTDGQAPVWNTSLGKWVPATVVPVTKRVAGVTFDGSGAPPVAGTKGYLAVPYTGSIISVSLVADRTGSAVVDVWKANTAIPSIANTITASDLPTLSSQQLHTDSTLTGWTTAVTAGDVIVFVLNSASTLTVVTVELTIAATS